MTDYQEDKLSMYEKVLAFLIAFATDLSTITQIAGIQSALDKKIDEITDAESIATEDTTGFTMQKSAARTALEEITLRVSRAAAAYFLSLGNTGMIKLSDYTKSELENARDNDLYAKAKRLWKIADPVKADLVNFNSSATEVDDLNTIKEAFFDIIQLPASKRGEKIASGKDVDELMADTDTLLDGLDIYLDTFSATNANMYSQYKTARAIDLTGGGSSNMRQGDINATAIANASFGLTQITTDTIVEFENTGTNAQLTFYFGSSATSPTEADRPSYTLNPGQSQTVKAIDAGFDIAHPALNIYNADAVNVGKWKVRIVE